MDRMPKLEIDYLPTEGLVPYARNAKLHGEEDVSAIAASIEEFGFDDPVGVWTNPDGAPEIVEGHGRVLAAKRLGLQSVPVVRLDHLTDGQRRAYTHVHNQTAMNSGFDPDALSAELASIQGFEWGDFGFDASWAEVPEPSAPGEWDGGIEPGSGAYGDERLRTDRAYNLDIVNRSNCGDDGMPLLRAVDHAPGRLVGFNYAKTSGDVQAGIHFFIDDYQFERCWNEPRKYVDVLRKFDCALTPDFSLYMDMPYPMQQWNVYRSRALGHYWQREGLTVIPTLSCSTPESFSFAFAGLEPGGTYAVSTVGVKKDESALKVWHDGMESAMDRLRPRRILQYGGDIGFDYGGCEVVDYKNEVTERMSNGR